MNAMFQKQKASTKPADPTRISLFVTIILLLLYGEFFILNSSFIVEDTKYFCLFDDAMISMRYAKNLAAGHGLVWNPGEAPLEGYTNFLWVMMMTGLHLLPVPPSKISMLVQICSLLLLCINLVYVRRIAMIVTKSSFPATTCALLFTAFYFPLNKWSLMGMETGAVTLAITMAVYHIMRMMRENTFSPVCYLILGIGTLIRIDVFLLFGIAVLTLFFLDKANQNRHLIGGGGLLLLFLAGQTTFRIWYFHDILPNTYYLKMTGYPVWFRMTNGLQNTFNFVYGMNAFLFMMPFGLLLFDRKNRKLKICAVFIATQLFYSIYTGGDITDAKGLANRFLCIVMPAFFILFSHTLVLLRNILNDVLKDARFRFPGFFRTGFIGIIILCLLYLNAGPSCQYLKQWLLMQKMAMVYANKHLVVSADYISSITEPEATVAVTWAGVLPYFLNRPVIDLLGKNDITVSRIKVDLEPYVRASGATRYTAFMPGHTKWDYGYSIGRLQPDIVWQLFPDRDFRFTRTALEEAFPFLYGRYVTKKFSKQEFFVKNNSPHIHWNKL